MKKNLYYIKNKDLLIEIHKSKNTYCYYETSSFSKYDIIVSSLDKIDTKVILEAKNNYFKNRKSGNFKSLDEISDSNLVFRVITFSHIPEEIKNNVGKKSKREKEKNLPKLNFTPFKHYVIEKKDHDKIYFREVGRSHWLGDLNNGYFSSSHGNITDNLALMICKLVEKYSQKSNWRGYTWMEDMKNQAILQLIENSLKFDEFKSNNPFAYFTCIVANSFRGSLNNEDKIANIKNLKMMEIGFNPSFQYQIDYEINNEE